MFEGGPVLVPPLRQDKENRRPIAVEGATLDTAAVCPPLSIVERARLDELKARERARLAPETAKAREAFIEAQAKKLVARTGMSENAARQVIVRQCEGVLRPDVELPFDDPELAGCTVGDVLADPERFEGETLADPLEGVELRPLRRQDHAPGRRHAVDPFVRPRPHHLRAQARRHQRAQGDGEAAKDEVVATFARLAVGADLDAVELAELRQLAKKLSGVGLRVIDGTLKAAQQKQAAQNAKAARAARPPAGRTRGPDPAPFPMSRGCRRWR